MKWLKCGNDKNNTGEFFVPCGDDINDVQGRLVKNLYVREDAGDIRVNFEDGAELRIFGNLMCPSFVSSPNVKGHAPASESELPPQSETSPNPPDPNTEREAGCSVPTCSASSDSLWPCAIDLRKPDQGASMIEADALVFLWQYYENNSYFDTQHRLIELGLKNGDIYIDDESIARLKPELS